MTANVGPVDWLEVALDYRCNLRCIGCRACLDSGGSMSSTDARALLEEARENGITKLWIGGGEPTLRDDLLRVIATARTLGFERILLQTNGLRLSYASYVAALVKAGVTDVSVNAKSHDPNIHDTASGLPGAHALLVRALEHLRREAIRRSADVLLTRSTAAGLPETLQFFADRGVSSFTLWLLSAADLEDSAVDAEIPRIEDLHGPLRRASALADRLGIELVSLHTPPCTLPRDLRHRHLAAGRLRLQVVEPSGRSFPLETSPIEGGVFEPGCGACLARPACHGARADYVRLHGVGELRPVTDDDEVPFAAGPS